MKLKEVKKPDGKYEYQEPELYIKTNEYLAKGFYIGNKYYEEITYNDGKVKYFILKWKTLPLSSVIINLE